jgi:hypothetical protein
LSAAVGRRSIGAGGDEARLSASACELTQYLKRASELAASNRSGRAAEMTMNPTVDRARHPLCCLWGVAAMLLAGCGANDAPQGADCDLELPFRVVIFEGDGQRALPGTQLGRLSARLRCSGDLDLTGQQPQLDVSGETLTWTVTGGGGTIDGAASVQRTTNSDGFTDVLWTLGPVFGTQTVQVSYARSGENRDQTVGATFTATAALATGCEPTVPGTDHGALRTISADETWTAATGPHRGGMMIIDGGATLTVQAGAVVCVESIDSSSPAAGRLVAEGTAQAKARFVGSSLPAASVLRHVSAENARAIGRANSGHLLSLIEDSNFFWSAPREPLACAQVAVGGGSAAVRRTVISGHGSATCAALHAAAFFGETVSIEARVRDAVGDAVLAGGAGTVALSNCELSSSGRHGLFVFGPGSPPANSTAISINGCNLTDNVGDAIRSEQTITVDATNNWWGDVAGAFGSNVDGVTGAINVGGHLTAPAVLGY